MHLAVLVAVGASMAMSDFDRCARLWRDDSQGRSVAACVRTAAETSGRWQEAASWLEAAVREHPSSSWVALELAEVRRQLRAADALDSYVAAIARFVARTDDAGEAEARVAYGVALYGAARPQDAWGEVALIHEAAKRGGDAQVIARGLVYEAWLAHQTGERLGRAMRALHDAELLVFPNGRYANQVRVLLGLGNVSLEFGRYAVALSYYERAMSLAREHDDVPMVAFAGSNMLAARRKQMEQRPDLTRLPALTDEARRLVATADTTRNALLQAVAHLALGDLLASARATRDQASTHYELALSYARRSGDRNQLATCLWALGRFLADERPAESQRLIDEALQMAVRSGSATSIAYAWRQQMRLGWKSLRRDRAVAESFRALDAIETLRTLQGVDLERASIFGAWTTDYHWLMGQLLGPAPRSRESVSLAFSVSERMRARALLDALQRPRTQDRTSPSQVRRVELLQAVSAIQGRLLDPAVRGVERQHAVRELERLEREEANVRAGDRPAGTAVVTASELASLDIIERSLGANEALLSFIVGVGPNFYGESEGGAWLLVVTAQGTRVIELPDRTRLEPMLSVFRGLLERSDYQADGAPAVSLYQTLLRDAIESLPQNVTRLIVIPDGPLHHLAFTSLQPAANISAIGTAYEMVVAPSATFWKHLTGRATIGSGTTLVLADPVVPNADRRSTIAQQRDWSLDSLELGRLAFSRAEGRAVVSSMGGGSRLLAGADATETAVKTLAREVGIVHFATHALVDEMHPERSAILLTGGGGEDGLLQAREIAELSLDGRVVVLSACRSVGGAVLGGEGVVGLSRSFFEAGTRTVVGTLWPIRDDHAAAFSEVFYAALAEGRSVGSALREARRRSIASGMPAAGWASYIAIGDDTIVPLPAGSQSGRSWETIGIVALMLTLVVVVVTTRRLLVKPARP